MLLNIKDFIEKTNVGNEIPNKLKKKIGGELKNVDKNDEYDSWVNSYKELASVLAKCKCNSYLKILLEYNLRRTPFRCDAILMGKKNGVDKLLVIELKQWEQGHVFRDDKDNVRAYGKRKEHPVLQALGYENFFKEAYVAVSENNIAVDSCAFLHNYCFTDDITQDQLYYGYEDLVTKENGQGNRQIRMFGKNEYDDLANFISNSFDGGSNTVADLIFNSAINLKSFIENLGNIVEGKPVFQPTDEQNRVIGNILDNLNSDPHNHQIFIVKGGPGTGKTVLGFNLLVKLGANTELGGLGLEQVKYVTKNSQLVGSYKSELNTYGKMPAYKNRTLNALFSQINPVYNDDIIYDCLIVDEAQRLPQTYQQPNKNWSTDILITLVRKTRNIVFLLDDDQKLAFNDILFSDQVEKLSKLDDVHILPHEGNEEDKNEYTLYQAFRTFGSREHLNWIDRFLGYKYAQNAECRLADGYDIRVVALPDNLHDMVHDKCSHGESARVLSGLCWLWKKESKDDNTVPDIRIFYDSSHDYKFSWNRECIKDWAVNPDCINEVGCVHTVLGQEFDYAGVIIGTDLKYVNRKVTPDPDENTQFMRYNNDSKRVNGMPLTSTERKTVINLSSSKDKKRLEEAKELVRNHYHILLTRGKKGCYIYCVEPELRKHLCKLLGQEDPGTNEMPVTKWKEENVSNDSHSAPRCPKCGKEMVRRRGYSEFYGCSDYPNCNGVRQIKE